MSTASHSIWPSTRFSAKPIRTWCSAWRSRSAKAALAIRVDGELRDLAAPLPEGGAEIAILTERDPEALELIRDAQKQRQRRDERINKANRRTPKRPPCTGHA